MMVSLRSCDTEPCSQHLVKRSWRVCHLFAALLIHFCWYAVDSWGLFWVHLTDCPLTSSTVGKASSFILFSGWGHFSKKDSSTWRLFDEEAAEVLKPAVHDGVFVYQKG